MELSVGIVAILALVGILVGAGSFFDKKKIDDLTPAQMRVVRILAFVLAATTIFVRWSLMFGR